MLLQLKRTWQGGRFQRFARDVNGNHVARFKWKAGDVVEVPDEHLEVVLNDIGNALIEVALDDKGRPRPVRGGGPAEDPKPQRRRRRSESLVEA